MVRTFADLNLGLAYMEDRELVKAADAFRDAVSQGSVSENQLASLTATSHLASVLILRGRLHEAAKLSRRTIRDQLERHGKPPPTLCMIHLRLGWVLAEWNDVDGFFAHLSQGVIPLLGRQASNGSDHCVLANSLTLICHLPHAALHVLPGHIGRAGVDRVRCDQGRQGSVLSVSIVERPRSICARTQKAVRSSDPVAALLKRGSSPGRCGEAATAT